MSLFEAIAAFYQAEREGDAFLMEAWLRHLEFLRDLQNLTTK